MDAQAFTVVVEKAPNNYAAFSPDVPGCVATGKTIDDTVASYRDALSFHLEGLLEDGLSIPQPKPLESHLAAGLLDADLIAEEYFISSIRIHLPRVAVAA